MRMTRNKSYKELSQLKTFEERYNYLKLKQRVSDETFSSHRWVNQMLYRSPEWRRTRRNIIIRDNACDLGIEDYPLFDHITIHHINPITLEDIESGSILLFDEDNLICVSDETHKAIHYGMDDDFLKSKEIVRRYPGDTCPWRKKYD
jgi:hypothetical protein